MAEAFMEKSCQIVMVVDPRDEWSIAKIRRRLGRRVGLVFLRRLRSPREGLNRLLVRLPSRVAELVALRSVISDTDLVICTGSNHGLLPSLAARLLGRPVLCIEAIDRIVTRSKTVALLHDIGAALVAIHWPSQRRLYRRSIVVGPIYEKPIYRPRSGGYILVITGSEGNPALVKKLLKTRLSNVVIQTGRTIPPGLIKQHKPGWKAFRYHPDIARLMAEASLVVAHQGLSIVEAALAYQKPVLLALNPDLPSTSGERDAEKLARYLGTKCINPRRITPMELEKEILRAMDRRPPKYPPGAKVLVENIWDILGRTRSL